MHHICGMILLLWLFVMRAENSFLWHNNSYQGWPSVKILTKILNIWANRTICLEILFWIRDESSFFLITTNSWINLVHEQRFIIGNCSWLLQNANGGKRENFTVLVAIASMTATAVCIKFKSGLTIWRQKWCLSGMLICKNSNLSVTFRQCEWQGQGMIRFGCVK